MYHGVNYLNIHFNLGAYALLDTGKVSTVEQGQEKIAEVLKNGAAKVKMMAMLEAQGVKKSVVKSMFKSSDITKILKSFQSASYSVFVNTKKAGVCKT